ncbi:MAG: type II toxin-antitoxin system RelE/ParE family toxin [Bauldia sp.]|nr:type II toxin-antitoxin system RelE/ParE family toxin [Bauldia sp.]
MDPVWSRDATDDLTEIRNYVSAANPAAAGRLAASILESVASLERFPRRGRVGRIAGTRELVVVGTAYIVAYRIRGDRTLIVRILHAARRWPTSLSD